ncbi:MAG: glycosyltransferase family A protein [Thermoanaerobaculaceae bacterium]|nr:glycosyltransferase family A protein [Thermoanaerobaculaceae bacterium]
MNKLHVVVVAYHRPIALRMLIDCFLLQTYQDWIMTIFHDGPAPQSVKDVIAGYNDPRIIFLDSATESGNHGYYIRKGVLKILKASEDDFILNTNDDNYYVPRFIELMMREITPETGIVFCDTVHSHQEYNLQVSELKVSGIDLGAFIVRMPLAKEVGFTHDTYAFDGYYAEDCLSAAISKGLRAVHVRKPLFIHN